MTYQKITEIPAIQELAGTESVYVRQGNAFVQVPLAVFLESLGSGSGADGGYYAPSVDSAGNLTWTASKTGMPVVAGANIKGPEGDTGRGIVSISRTEGDGAPGTTDTYTITYTDGTRDTFQVYNGKDGADSAGGSGGVSSGDYLPLSGGTMTGDLLMGNHNLTGIKKASASALEVRISDDIGAVLEAEARVTGSDGTLLGQRVAFNGIVGDEPVILENLMDPENESDAANKHYVDSAITSALDAIPFAENNVF